MRSVHSGSQPDLFGSADYLVKFVLEGHDRGVNWASFHPTLPLIVSGADDRQVRIWRLSETKAWEVDSCRGHFNNVSCAIFHPKAEVILSNSEDKTIRVWDMAKRSAIHVYRRENDRYWILASHPELAIFAAGHDSGMVIFKIERERPAATISGDSLFYIKDKYLRMQNIQSKNDLPLVGVQKKGPLNCPTKTISYNPAENSVLLCDPSEAGSYELYNLPKNGTGQEMTPYRGIGNSAIFVARNRFAVLEKASQVLPHI
jgi:coatomer protein complex subunit alpha (xenin)